MNHLKQYDVVRITKLNRSDRDYQGTASVNRSPQVGDVGTILEIFPPKQGLYSWCIVDCVDKDGLTVWMADFTADELELVETFAG